MILPRSDTHFSHFLDSDGNYQREHRDLALSFCTSHRTVIDVGAHVGYWSSEFESLFDSVHAFEPIVENAACLKENTIHTNIHIHALGDGSSSTIRLRHIRDGNSGTWAADTFGREVLCRSLDSFRFKTVDLIKIDVEGSEVAVLHGASETILQCQPVVIVELRDTATLKAAGFPGECNLDETVEFLAKLGLRLVGKTFADYVFAPGK